VNPYTDIYAHAESLNANAEEGGVSAGYARSHRTTEKGAVPRPLTRAVFAACVTPINLLISGPAGGKGRTAREAGSLTCPAHGSNRTFY